MKKALIVLMVLLIGAAGLFAQDAGTFTLGGRAGMAFGFHNSADWFRDGFLRFATTLGADDVNSSDGSMKMNFNAAIFAAYTIIDNLSLQLELNVMVNQGAMQEISASPGFPAAGSLAGDLHFSYSSLDIPLLVRYSFLDEMISVVAGPHISIPLGRPNIEIERDADGGLTGLPFSIDTAVTFGLTAGVVGAFPIGPGRIIGDLRFLFDFNPVKIEMRNPDGDSRSFDFMTRRALVFTLGYQLSLRN